VERDSEGGGGSTFCGTHSTLHKREPAPHSHCMYIVLPLRPCFFPPLFLFRYAMEAGHPSLYLVYDYMEGGDLGRALAIPPGSHGALTQGERFKVCVCVLCFVRCVL